MSLLTISANCSISFLCSLPSFLLHRTKDIRDENCVWISNSFYLLQMMLLNKIWIILVTILFSPNMCFINCAASKYWNLVSSGEISFANSYRLGNPFQKRDFQHTLFESSMFSTAIWFCKFRLNTNSRQWSINHNINIGWMWELRFISTYLKLLLKFNFVIEWRRNYGNFSEETEPTFLIR